MKISKLLSLVALALMTAACSEQIEQVQKPRTTEGIPFTATISTEGHAATRALAESGTSITATWATGEKVALVHNGVNDEMTVASVSGGVATITGTITGNPGNGDAVTVIYPSSAADGTTGNVKEDALIGQDGTLIGTAGTSISEKYDIRKSSGATLKVENSKATLNGNVSLDQQVSIWKLTLQNGGSSLSAKALAVRDASDNLLASATLATAGDVFYVAVPAMTSAKIIAVNGANSYSYSNASVSISAGKYYQSTVSLTSDYTDLSALESANTYMVTAAGNYKFNATIKGNGGIDPLTGTTATPISKSSIAGVKVLWELKAQGLAVKHNSTNYDIFYADGYVYFSTPSTFTSGDAYVAVYDSEGTILWSWLIWATEAPATTTYEGLGVMDRNIGALNVNSDTYRAGFLYQWGRKDPFPAGTIYNQPTQYVYVPTRTLALGYEENNDGFTMAFSVAHPSTQLGPQSDCWLVASEFNVNLWRSSTGTKTIYDPCPAGWRIPTKDEISKVWASGVTLPGGGSTAGNSRFDGYCNGGSQYYWTSTAESRTDAWCCHNGNVRTAAGAGAADWRLSSSMSIRPVKDPASPLAKGFSVSATKQVAFAPGNLQKVNGVWQFASHQYDYFGESQTDSQRDLFSYAEGYTYSCPSPWRVLTSDEWDYVLNTRSVTNTLSSGARYTMATLSGSYKGMIIFPDNYSHPTGTGFSGGTYNAPSNYTATVDLTGWTKMEAAGAIFLPAAGYYTFNADPATYKAIGLDGTYYSTTPNGTKYYALYFGYDVNTDCNVWTADNSWSNTRRSIRPVRDLP